MRKNSASQSAFFTLRILIGSFFVLAGVSGTPALTVNLTGVGNAQAITVTLSAVNDGAKVGNVPVPMAVLAGDTNADYRVNVGDPNQKGCEAVVSKVRGQVSGDGRQV